jgi:chromosome segregation ATPase
LIPPEEEVNSSGSTGAAKMVGLEQEWPPPDMNTKLADKEATIRDLRHQLTSSTEQQEKMQQDFQVKQDQYETVIADKNAEIQQLNDKVEKCKVQISNLEKTKTEDRKRYELEIEGLQKKVESKEEEIRNIKEDFENKRLRFENDKMQLQKEIIQKQLDISRMETREQSLMRELADAKTSTAVAEKTIAESETAKVRVELKKETAEKALAENETATVKAQLARKTSEVQVITERLNSITSSRSDSSASDIGGITERFNSMTSSRSDSLDASMRQASDSGVGTDGSSTFFDDSSLRSDNDACLRQASDNGASTRLSSSADHRNDSQSAGVNDEGVGTRPCDT